MDPVVFKFPRKFLKIFHTITDGMKLKKIKIKSMKYQKKDKNLGLYKWINPPENLKNLNKMQQTKGVKYFKNTGIVFVGFCFSLVWLVGCAY